MEIQIPVILLAIAGIIIFAIGFIAGLAASRRIRIFFLVRKAMKNN